MHCSVYSIAALDVVTLYRHHCTGLLRVELSDGNVHIGDTRPLRDYLVNEFFGKHRELDG
jgi:hypothetical protein